MKETRNHIHSADGIRVLAILAVVVLHTSASGVIQYGKIAPVHWWTSNTLDSMSRWAMPLFIMLSGSLNLGHQQNRNAGQFLTKRFKRVGVPLVVWGAINFLWNRFYEGQEITLDYIISSVARGLIINHLYFLVILIMLYATTPVLDILISRVSNRFLIILSLLWFTAASTGLLFQYIPMNALTMFIPYISYYLAGFLVRSYLQKTVPLLLPWIAYILTSALISLKTGELVSIYGINDYRALSFYDYFNPAVIIQTICVFFIIGNMMMQIKSKTTLGLFQYFSRLSFGVYLSHFMFLGLAIGFIRPLFEAYSSWEILIIAPLVYVFSALLTTVLINIPYLCGIVGETGKISLSRKL